MPVKVEAYYAAGVSSHLIELPLTAHFHVQETYFVQKSLTLPGRPAERVYRRYRLQLYLKAARFSSNLRR